MTLKLNTLLDVVKVHAHAKFHQAKCSGLSWSYKKNSAKNNNVVATADSNNKKSELMLMRRATASV